MSNVWTGRALAAVAGGILLRANPLLGALVALLVWMFALERRRPAQSEAASLAKPRPQRDDSFAVLGVSPAASDAEIEQAYRRAVAQVHPDRHAQGSEAARADAERRTREINAAYRFIKTQRRGR